MSTAIDVQLDAVLEFVASLADARAAQQSERREVAAKTAELVRLL